MFINFKKKLIENLPKNILQPRRAQIYVGFQCHQRCGFCYYKYKCCEDMFSLDFIKKQIDFELAYGIVDIEITGGEPSEHKQLREICQYIKERSPQSKIAVITNGGLYTSNVWDLIDEVLVSYHISKDDASISKQFFPNGHTYVKVAKTIDKAKQRNLLVRTNTVLAVFNLCGLQHILNDLVSFQPDIVNFLPINVFDQAAGMASQINYVDLRPKVRHAIDFLKDHLTDASIYVRYMPFCQMEGYECHIAGNLQHIYDWFDWNREIDGVHFLKYIQSNKQDQLLRKLGKYGSTSIDKVIEIQNKIYYKSSKCLKCKYLMVCDGVEDIDRKHLLENSIQPSYGKTVEDFMFFIQKQNSTEKIYRKWYEEKD